MKIKFKPKDIIVPTVVLFAIASVCTAILAFTNSVTYEKIKQSNEKTKIETRIAVCPFADSFSDDKTAAVDGVEYVYNEALDENGNTVGYVFTSSDKGYGGTVSVMVGFGTNGKVTGVQTIELSETAGLGMNAKKAEFRDQYKDKIGPFKVNKDSSKNDGGYDEIDALTGATITSRAVTNAVNKTVEVFKTVTGGDINV